MPAPAPRPLHQSPLIYRVKQAIESIHAMPGDFFVWQLTSANSLTLQRVLPSTALHLVASPAVELLPHAPGSLKEPIAHKAFVERALEQTEDLLDPYLAAWFVMRAADTLVPGGPSPLESKFFLWAALLFVDRLNESSVEGTHLMAVINGIRAFDDEDEIGSSLCDALIAYARWLGEERQFAVGRDVLDTAHAIFEPLAERAQKLEHLETSELVSRDHGGSDDRP